MLLPYRLHRCTALSSGKQGSCGVQWDWLKAEQEKEELQQCTFAPAVKGGQEGRAPLHRRLEDLQRQRRSAALALPPGSHPWPSTVTEAPRQGHKMLRRVV